MSLRIRQVKPEFWRDAHLADLSDTDKLVYIGLWMVADDTGTFRVDVQEIATDLFPYLSRTAREKKVTGSLERLVVLCRVVLEDCGRHAAIPTMGRHQRMASPEKQVRTVAREHAGACLNPSPAGTRGELQTVGDAPARNGTVRNGKGTERGGVGGSPSGSGPFEIIDGRLTRRTA
jgi:hypothetical protein